MKLQIAAIVASVGLALAVAASAQTTSATASPTPDPSLTNISPNPNPPGLGNDAFTTNTEQRTFTVTGTVVRARNGQLVVRIDDHKHTMPFQLSQGAEAPAPGSRVAVTYRPTGETGQAAERVQVLQGARRAGRSSDEDGRRR